ncbi:Polyadenylate-binding protein 2 [Capsicum annuum]|nr:Polyadenylate-binding protein 2 [Capsicum annuum]
MDNITITLSASARTEGFMPFSIDPSHPFYIHPSDNRNTSLVSPPFDGNGFVIWRRSMLVAFFAKNKLGVITGPNPQPSEDSPYYQASTSSGPQYRRGDTPNYNQRFHFEPKKLLTESSIPAGFTKDQYQHYQYLLSLQDNTPSLKGKLDDNGVFSAFGPSLKRPLEIGKAANKLYFICQDHDTVSPCTTLSSFSHSTPVNNSSTCFSDLHSGSIVPSASYCNSSNVLINNTFCLPVSPTNKLDIYWHQSSTNPRASSSDIHIQDPQFYHQEASNPSWQEAMLQEFKALKTNQTWDIVPFSTHKKAIPYKWVYKIKQKFDEVYMKLPLGLKVSVSCPSQDPLVCRLKKSLYGLKQASRQWFSRLSKVLLSKSFFGSKNDYSLFTKGSGSFLIVIVVYVDDILLAGANFPELTSLKFFLDAQLKIKDLGSVHYFLGLKIEFIYAGFIINQRKYTLDLLHEFYCDHYSPVSTPLDSSIKLLVDMDAPPTDPCIYRRLVGKLNYLQHTLPDISFSVQHLSQFLNKPQVPHMMAALHVLHYLMNAPDLELSWLKRLLGDMGLLISSPIPVFCDSQDAIHIAKNTVFHERIKYIDVGCHFVHDCLSDGLISLQFLRSTEQLADLLTKTDIDWFPGKCLTKKMVARIQHDMQEDYEIGSIIRNKIIPKAVLWFTGEAEEEDSIFMEFDIEAYEDTERHVTRHYNVENDDEDEDEYAHVTDDDDDDRGTGVDEDEDDDDVDDGDGDGDGDDDDDDDDDDDEDEYAEDYDGEKEEEKPEKKIQVQHRSPVVRGNGVAAAASIAAPGGIMNQFKPTSLYVGDLDINMTDTQLYELFNQVGQVISVRICRDLSTQRSLGYGFVNYSNPQDAAKAMEMLDSTPVNGKSIRVKYSHRDPNFPKSRTANLFVRNLDKSIDNKALHDTFSSFGSIVSCKVVTDSNGQSKCYGFVQFDNDESAQSAIDKLNGMVINNRQLYVAHALRK